MSGDTVLWSERIDSLCVFDMWPRDSEVEASEPFIAGSGTSHISEFGTSSSRPN